MRVVGKEHLNMRIKIVNGIVVTAEAMFPSDVLINGERIEAIGLHLPFGADEVVDAGGCYILPGGVDEHTHFGSFGGLLFDTTKAAAVGGTTTIVDFAPQELKCSITEAIERHAEKAAGTSCVDYAFHSMVMQLQNDTFEQIARLPEHGVSSVKMFTAYKGTPFYMEDESIVRAMLAAKEVGLTMMIHAENADIITIETEKLLQAQKTEPVYHCYARPPIAEIEATRHIIELAAYTQCPTMVMHVSTRGAMEAICNGRCAGRRVKGETCTQYLTLDTSFLDKPNFEGAKYVCSPPLRSREHINALWQAISNGWIDAVSSDHCAVSGGFEAKKRGMHDFSKIPNGIPGVQNRLEMLWAQGVVTGKITPMQFVNLTATMPAKNVGLKQKGQIAPGFDADIVIFDPTYRGIITQADNLEGLNYNTYEGFPIIGRPEKVYLRGKLIAKSGKFVGKNGDGKRLCAEPYGDAYRTK